jgi:hypothetical protein
MKIIIIFLPRIFLNFESISKLIEIIIKKNTNIQ